MNVGFALTGDLFRNSRAIRQVRALAESGFLVTVLHFPSSDTRPNSRQQPGDNVRIVNARPTSASSGPRMFGQIHRSVALALKSSNLKFDCLHASDLFVLPALAQHRNQQNVPLTFDSRELYTHVAATKRRPWARLAWHLVQQRYLQQVSVAFTVSDGIADHLAAKYQIERPIVLWNVPMQNARAEGPDVRTEIGLPIDAFLAIHLGALRHGRGTEHAIHALHGLPKGHLAFVGAGPLEEGLRNLAHRLAVSERVHFVPPVPPQDVTTFARTADVGLTLLDDTCLNHRLALPNKLFEYIGAGVPVLASNLREIKRLVQDHGIGKCVEPRDVAALTDGLATMAGQPELRKQWADNCGKTAAVVNWTDLKDRFVNPFQQLLSS